MTRTGETLRWRRSLLFAWVLIFLVRLLPDAIERWEQSRTAAEAQLYGFFVIVAALISVALPLWVVVAYLHPVLEIAAGELRFWHLGALKPMRVRLDEVAGIEWEGMRDVALRMRSGTVVGLDLTGIPKRRRAAAKAAVKSALETHRRE